MFRIHLNLQNKINLNEYVLKFVFISIANFVFTHDLSSKDVWDALLTYSNGYFSFGLPSKTTPRIELYKQYCTNDERNDFFILLYFDSN